MPTFSTAKLPRSASAEEFENMCADVLHIKYNCHFEKYGRRGQKQNGIDLVGLSETTILCCSAMQKLQRAYVQKIENAVREGQCGGWKFAV